MINYLRQRNPLNYLILLGYCILVNLTLFIKPPEPVKQTESIIGAIINLSFLWPKPGINAVISIVIILSTALFLNLLYSRLKVFSEINLLPAFIFVSIVAMFPAMPVFTYSFFSMMIMLIVIYNLLKIFDMAHTPEHIFYTSFFLGIAGLLYFPAFYFFIFIMIAFPVLKRPSLSELLLIPIGGAFPLFLLAFFYYFTDRLPYFRQIFISVIPRIQLPDLSSYSNFLFPVIVLFILLSLGFFQDQFYYVSKNVRESRFTSTFSVYFLICGIIFIFLNRQPFLFAVFFLIPVTYFLNNIFLKGAVRMVNVLIYTLLIVVVIQQLLFIY